jgi:hypothetical protein
MNAIAVDMPPNVPDERRAADDQLQALYLSRVRSIRLLDDSMYRSA